MASLQRQIVAETLEPGLSVSIVARRHPVEIVPEQDRGSRAESGNIEIEFGNGARLRVRRAVAPEMRKRSFCTVPIDA